MSTSTSPTESTTPITPTTPIAPEDTPTCNTCQTPQSSLSEPLKHCGRCRKARYCSSDCQKSDWKTHKQMCKDPNAKPKPKPAHNPGFHNVNALLGLSSNDFLHKLPEKDTFGQLIDCFRMRVDDEYVFAGNLMGIYNEEDPRREFRKFLDLAEKREGLLPGWWNKEKRKECERVALDKQGSTCIMFAVEKADIQDSYKDPTMPMKLRVLGEKIYGRGFM